MSFHSTQSNLPFTEALSQLPFVNVGNGGPGLAEVATTVLVLTVILLTGQVLIARIFWNATRIEAAKVCAITVLGMCLVPTILLAPVFPIAAIAAHFIVRNQRGA